MKLGDWLVSRGKLTQEQLARALQDKAFFNARLGTSLLKLGYIDEDMLGEYLADVSRTRYCPSQRLEAISPDVIATVPARVAAKYLVVPFAIETRKLHLAMRDPKDLMALDEIAFLTGLPIEPYVATEFRIQRAIERYYRIRLGTESIPVTPAPVPRPGRPVERQPPPVGPAGPEIGLDGLPIDADPGDLDQPFVTPTAAPPAMDSQGPLPASLDAWRAAQEEAGAPPPGSPEAAPRAGATQPVSPMAPHPVAIPGPAARAGRPAAARPAPAEAARGGPPTLETITSRLREAETRDDVFEAVLDFTSTHFSRSALFVVQQDRVLGWSGRGEGLFAARIRNVIVPLNRPSLFVFFRSGGDYFYGPVPDLPANAKFYLDLGCPPPARVFLLPLTIQGRTAVILYADYGQTAGRQPDVPVLRRLLMKASLALEVLILRNKIMMI